MPRNANFDYARLVAAFGIVVFHAGGPGGWLGYAGLPFFLILLIVFACPGAMATSFAVFAGNRAQRLLMPWLVWSGVYGALKVADAMASGAPLAAEFAPWMVLTGPALHLWFLPFAWVASLALWPILRFGRPADRNFVPMLLTTAALLALSLGQEWTGGPPLGQWLYALPAVFLGLAFATAPGRLAEQAVLLGCLILVAWVAGWTSGLMQLGIAGGAFILCSRIRLRPSALSRNAAPAALGVYLVHPLVLSVAERGAGLARDTLALAVAGCIGALAVTIVIAMLRQAAGWLPPRRDARAIASPMRKSPGWPIPKSTSAT